MNREGARSAKPLPWKSDLLFVSFILSIAFIVVSVSLIFIFIVLTLAINGLFKNFLFLIFVLLLASFIFSPGLLVSLVFRRYIASLRLGRPRHTLYERLSILAAFLTMFTFYILTFTWFEATLFLHIMIQ